MRRSFSRGRSGWLASGVSALGCLAITSAARATIISQEGFGEYTYAGYGIAYPYFPNTAWDNPGQNTGYLSFASAPTSSGGEFQPFNVTAGGLSYPGLSPVGDTTSNYLSGQGGGNGIIAAIDTNTSITYSEYGGQQNPLFYNAGYVTAGNTYVGVPTKSLWFSFVFQLSSTSLAGSSASAPGTSAPDQAYLELLNGSSSVFTVGQAYGTSNLIANNQVIGTVDDQVHLGVLEITYGATPSTDVENFYLDPTIGSALPQTPTYTAVTPAEFNSIEFFTQGNWMNYDDLRFGTTYADVTPSSTPEPAGLAIVGVPAAILLRRRRRTQRRE